MYYILYAVVALLIVGPVYMIIAITQMRRKMRKIDWLNAQEYTVLRIDVPRNNEKSPLAAEQMFASLHGIFSESAEFQNHISFEIVSKDKYIQFYIYLPVHLKDFVEGQVYAQYPTVEINQIEDYITHADINGKSYAICELDLTKPEVYPIKQFTDFEVDPLSGVTSVMSKLNEGEEVWFQMIIRPVGDNWQERGHAMVESVRSGKKLKGGGVGGKFGKAIFGFLSALLTQAVNPGAETVEIKSEVKLPASVEDALKNIEQKITKLGFQTKIRILALGHDSVTTKLKCQTIAAAFKQYNTTNLNGFRIGEIAMNDQAMWKDYAYRSFEDEGNIFNIAELASIYHLPHMSVSTPNIVWAGSKKSEPPANLPIRENMLAEEFTVLGETNFRNQYKEFGIKRDDRRRHIYIVGKSGVGKSTLIENMAINDVQSGRGVIAVDPHGDLADKILACIPNERVDDVIMFDPSDREYPIAFNLLEAVDDDFKGLVASGFVGIFKKIFGESWGPRLEHILRNTVLALLDFDGSTMLDIPKMLTNNSFRERVVDKIKDMVIKDFWMNEFAQYDAKFRTEAVSPILNKVGQFLSSSTIRNIVGQPKSRINIREIMDQKKILVVNLSRGKIGEDNSALLGAMMITKIQLAAMSRADVTADQRPDCYLYVDEFQNFATDSFATILSEARKYNLALTMAHQYIAQMPETVRDAVFGNAGTIISYRVGAADAEVLVKEFEPVFLANDLVNLDKFHTYVKLLIDGISCPAFSARTLPPVQKLSGNLEKVIAHSRQSYSNTRAQIEQELIDRNKEEEERMKREAELFKSGGLEALLTQKGGSVVDVGQQPAADRSFSTESKAQPTTSSHPLTAPAAQSHVSEPSPIIAEKTNDNRGVAAPEETNKTDQNNEPEKPSGPRVVRHENILNGKLYKERTARGGVKWYIGEEVDEEKLRKGGTIVDDKARELVELTKPKSSREAEENSEEAVKQSSRVAEDITVEEQPTADRQQPIASVNEENEPLKEHLAPSTEAPTNLPMIEQEPLPAIMTTHLPQTMEEGVIHQINPPVVVSDDKNNVPDAG